MFAQNTPVLTEPPGEDLEFLSTVIGKLGEFPDGSDSYTKGVEEELARKVWPIIFTPERQRKIQAIEKTTVPRINILNTVQAVAQQFR